MIHDHPLSTNVSLLLLVMLIIMAALAGLSVFINPNELALGPLLLVPISIPVAFAWWFWVRQRQHPQIKLILALVFLALSQMAPLTAGLVFICGLIYLWFQIGKGRQA